jgi:anti-sigma factor RsiW
MSGQERIELERAIHDLLCGRLNDADRIAILRRIALDEQLREVLKESIQIQELVRAAFGYPVTDQQIPVPPALAEPANADRHAESEGQP